MISGRLKKYISSKSISYYAFENSIKASRGSISKAVKENKNIGSNVIENILSVYLDLNPVWLLTGKGEMLLNVKKTKDINDSTVSVSCLDNFKKIEIIDYISENIIEFKSHKSFQKLLRLLFADEEIEKVKNEIIQLKEQVSKMVKASNQ